MATLVFHLEDESEIVVPLLEKVSIGSSEGNDVLVEDSSIAPSHAEVAMSVTGSFVVRDLGSESGTYVNGRRIKSYPLCEGDEVAFGGLRGRFILDNEDRAPVLQREDEEREHRRMVEHMQKEYEQAHGKHQRLLTVLQGLGEEEKKRLDNLDNLQRAINQAETALAKAEAEVKKVRDEVTQGEMLRAQHVRLQEEVSKMLARREALQADQQKALATLQKEIDQREALAQKKIKEKEELSQKKLREEEELLQKRIQEKEALSQKKIEEGEAQSRRKIEESEAAAQKKIEEKEALSQRKMAYVEAGVHKQIKDKEVQAKQRLEEQQAAAQKQMADNEAISRQSIEENEALARKELDELSARQEAVQRELASLQEQSAKAQVLLAERKKALSEFQDSIATAEQRHEELTISLHDTETAIALSEAEKQRAEEARETEQQSLEKLLEEKGQLAEGIASLREKQGSLSERHATLAPTVAALEISIKDMTQRQSEGIAALRERERSLREALKGIERAKSDQADIVSATRDLETRRDELKARAEAFATQVSDSQARIVELDEVAKARQDQIATLTDRIGQLGAERDAVSARVEALSATEGKLVQAQKDLVKAKEDHAAFVALVAERDTRQRELEALEARVTELTGTRTAVEQTLAAGQVALKDFQRESAAEHERVAEELASLEKDAAGKRNDIAALLKQLQETTTRHEELLQHNRDLAGVEGKIRDSTSELARVEREQTALAAKTASFVKESESAHAKLQNLEAEVKSITATLQKRREEEGILNRAVARLQAEQTAETRRLEALRSTAAETERQAAAERAELHAALEKRRRELHIEEDQFRAIQSLREEIDELYAKIESGGEGNAAAALAAWKEAQRKKEELTGLLPKEGGIRVKPQVRKVLVPRSKEG